MLLSLKLLDLTLIYVQAHIARGFSHVTYQRSNVYLPMSAGRSVVVLSKLLLCSLLIRSFNLSLAT